VPSHEVGGETAGSFNEQVSVPQGQRMQPGNKPLVIVCFDALTEKIEGTFPGLLHGVHPQDYQQMLISEIAMDIRWLAPDCAEKFTSRPQACHGEAS